MIPMILYCPACGAQHIDRPQPEKGWTNPPHRSHECQACGCIWRPADVATTGVEKIETTGRADTWSQFGHCPATHARDAREISRRIALRVAEIPDRTSPEDQPEMMLVTPNELRRIVEDELRGEPA